ncbi:MAG: HIT family protein [Candidatus Aenigmarchaeota archaeon]|nr:HIT family protein [Candidatus Aenigmarchaeota archaeon]
MDECLFCKIVTGEIPSQKVYEDSEFFAFLDINPRNPGHTLVVPKKHYNTVMEMDDHEAGEFFKVVKKIAIAVKKGMNADGISLGQSNERAAGQVIPHAHFHVIPRFLTEGPPGLESILPTKKMTNEMLEKSVKVIQENIGASVQASRPEPAPEPQPEPSEPETEPVTESTSEPASEESSNGVDRELKKIDDEKFSFE